MSAATLSESCSDRTESCAVANQGCACPANHDRDPDDPGCATTCFACGNPVCAELCCSVERDYLRYGVQRICATCELTHFNDAELLQRQRAYQQAGYDNWFLLGARDHADLLLQRAERTVEHIYRIVRPRRERGKPSSFRAFSERHRP